MSTEGEGPYRGEGRTIDIAAEDAARQVPLSQQEEPMEMKIYAVFSGEHNPIHGYIVDLGP
jgi:hypothetical protein